MTELRESTNKRALPSTAPRAAATPRPDLVALQQPLPIREFVDEQILTREKRIKLRAKRRVEVDSLRKFCATLQFSTPPEKIAEQDELRAVLQAMSWGWDGDLFTDYTALREKYTHQQGQLRTALDRQRPVFPRIPEIPCEVPLPPSYADEKQWITAGLKLATRKVRKGVRIIEFLKRFLPFSFLDKMLRKRKSTIEDNERFLRGFDEIDAQVEQLEHLEDERRRLADETAREIDRVGDILEAGFRKVLQRQANQTRRKLADYPPFLVHGWSEQRWDTWNFDPDDLLPDLVVGQAVENSEPDIGNFSLPVTIPLLSSQKAFRIPVDSSKALFQSLILRTALMLPHRCKHTIIDLHRQGLGREGACPFWADLPSSQILDKQTLNQGLLDIYNEVTRIGGIVQDGSLFDLPDTVRDTVKFEFIFVANFPTDQTSRSIDLLQDISLNGPAAGKFLFIEWDPNAEFPRDSDPGKFTNLVDIDPSPESNHLPSNRLGLTFEPGRLPPDTFRKALLDRLGRAKPDKTLRWEEVSEPSTQWWQASSAQRISANVGVSSNPDGLPIWFGRHGDQPCHHGILVGMNDSGKSNFYRVLICALATRYSPDELRLYLIDGKDGVTFQPFRDLPHAEVVSLHTSNELMQSVLSALCKEMERRYLLFRKCGVQDLARYRATDPQGEPLPRILLLVDEYQDLFSKEDLRLESSTSIVKLAQKSRAAGIHMLLGSHQVEVAGMSGKGEFLDEIQLRLSFRITREKVNNIGAFGRSGKELIRQIDRIGQVVVNDRSGSDNANVLGRVSLIEQSEVTNVVGHLSQLARERSDTDEPRKPVIFDGSDQPDLSENPELALLLRHPGRPSPERWCDLAGARQEDGGLEIDRWYPNERPMVLWVGQENRMHGQARVVLRRRRKSNVAIAGGEPGARAGMLASMVFSAAVNNAPEDCRIRVIEHGHPSAPWNEALRHTVDVLGSRARYDARYELLASFDWIYELTTSLEERSALDPQDRICVPTLLVFVSSFEEVDSPGSVGSGFMLEENSDAAKLMRICDAGPRLGIHLIASCDTAANFPRAFHRKALSVFDHRIALQMPDLEAREFVGGRDPVFLNGDGSAGPIIAVHGNPAAGTRVRFRPYCAGMASPQSNVDPEDERTFQSQVDGLMDMLERWG